MDKNTIIKLTLIDIFPSLEEIEHNYKEEISIIFQGLNNFYNLKDLLNNKKEIYLQKKMQKNSIIISLVQSINILATGILNIKSGKQWVTFTYENKKKIPSSNFALSLMDCIKINIDCLIIYNNTEKYNNNYSNKTFNKNNLITKETKKNLAQKKNSNIINQKNIKEIIINNKYKHNNSQEHYLINSYNSNGRDSLYSTENEKKNNIKSKRDSNFIKNMNSFSTIGKENKKFDLNSSLSLSSNKYNHNFNMTITNQSKMYSTIRQKFKNCNKTNNSLYDNQSYNINEFQIEPKIEIKEEHNLIKKNKTNNQLNLNIVHKKQKSCNTLKIFENKTNLRYKNSGEKNGFKNLNDSNKKIVVNNTVERKNTKNNIISNKNYPFNFDRNHLYNISSTNTKSYYKKSVLMNSFQKDNNENIKNIDNVENKYITENNYFKHINLKNINNSILFNSSKQINSEKDNNDNNINLSENNLYERNQTVENMENIYLEYDNFIKLKEDFLLLYTNDYIKNVKEDLLKLEIELFVEKMTELTREYHIQLYEKLLEYQIEKNRYKKYLSNFSQLNKLYNKLHSIKANKEIKKNNMSETKRNVFNINNDIFRINQSEINLYKLLLNENSNSNIEKKHKLKNLLKIIVNKIDIKNIISHNNNNIQKIMNSLNLNNKNENNSLVRTRIIPKNQQTKINTNHLSLTNSYVWDNCNDKYENNLNDIYSKTHIFSPVIKIKDFKHINTSKRKNNADN